MLFVTHDQAEAMALGQRVAVMHQGGLRQVDVPQTVYDCPRDRFVATFVGSPPMNVVSGVLVGGAGEAEFRGGGLVVRVPDVESTATAPVELGVRPEAVRLVPGTEPPEAHGHGRVVRVESRGDHALVQVELDWARQEKSWLASKMGRESVPQAGQRVGVIVDTGRLHVFDPSTGRAWDRAQFSARPPFGDRRLDGTMHCQW